MPPYQQIIEGPAKTWRLVQKRAAIRRRGDDPDICKISQEDYDIESFYNVMTDRTIPQEVVEMSYPDHYRAMRWYLTNAPSSPRWHIEAWLLADGGLDNAIEHLGMSDWKLSLDIYRRAFFSISEEQRLSPAWMASNIWTPASMHQNSLYFYDYLLKLAAYYQPSLLEALTSHQALSTAAVKWLRQMVEDQRDRSMLLTGNISVKAPLELKMASNENTMRAWREDRASEGLAAQDSAALSELMQVVHDKVSILDHDGKLPERQDFNVEKYSDDELIVKPAPKQE